MGLFRKKKEEKWIVIKPAKVEKMVSEEKPMIIKDEKKTKRLSKEELKKYFPNLEFLVIFSLLTIL